MTSTWQVMEPLLERRLAEAKAQHALGGAGDRFPAIELITAIECALHYRREYDGAMAELAQWRTEPVRSILGLDTQGKQAVAPAIERGSRLIGELQSEERRDDLRALRVHIDRALEALAAPYCETARQEASLAQNDQGKGDWGQAADAAYKRWWDADLFADVPHDATRHDLEIAFRDGFERGWHGPKVFPAHGRYPSERDPACANCGVGGGHTQLLIDGVWTPLCGMRCAYELGQRKAAFRG